MSRAEFCGGCEPLAARSECCGSFGRLGVVKFHWECWSECNLPCSFCYRTRGVALDTEEARKLISTITTSGSEAIVFAGGDPSIRQDIGELIDLAHSQGLQVEVQTNAHHMTSEFVTALATVELVGLSLDGPDSDTHDSFRNRKGNFEKVVALLGLLNERGTPVVVRSVVAKPNYSTVPRIGRLLEGQNSVVRWSLLEFTAIGEGYSNRETYQLERSMFEEVAKEAQGTFSGPAVVDIYRAEAQVGAYALVTPGGELYGTGRMPLNGLFPIVGNMLREHLSVLAQRLPFSREHHIRRYGKLLRRN